MKSRKVLAVEVLVALAYAFMVLFWHWQVNANLLRHQQMLLPGGEPATAERGYRVFPDPDVYTWLTFAKVAMTTGQWRINFTDSDNPPHGREAHWNSLLMWVLIAAGWIRGLFTGEAPFTALENAAFWVNAFQFFCAAALLYVILRRLVGAVPTWIGLLLLAWMMPISWTFHPGRPDHQTLYFIAALGTTGCLLRGGLGWLRTDAGGQGLLSLPDLREARGWFLASAIFGAAGIWFGASVQITILAFAGFTVLGLVAFTPREEFESTTGARYEPRLWFEWGVAGGVATVIFFLIQYFPGDMRMRLESIHPFHALSWIGGGWVMMHLCRWRIEKDYRIFSQPTFYAALALAAVWPLATRIGPEAWHILRDPLIVRFQTRTMEGMPLPMAYGKDWMKIFFGDAAALPLLLLLIPVLAGSPQVSRPLWTRLFFLWIAATGYLIMTYWQGRWMMHWAIISILLACITLPLVWIVWTGWRRWMALAAVSLVIVGSAGWSAWRIGSDLYQQTKNNAIMPMFIDGLYIKRLAQFLNERHPDDDDIRLLLEPTSGPAIFYFGGIRSVGSLFWQNADGLRDHRDFLVDTDPERKRPLEIARNRDLDYVLIWESPASTTFPVYLAYGERIKEAEGDFFINSLVDGGPYLPEWLDPDYDLMFKAGGSFAESLPGPVPQMRIYRVLKPGEKASPKPVWKPEEEANAEKPSAGGSGQTEPAAP